MFLQKGEVESCQDDHKDEKEKVVGRSERTDGGGVEEVE